MLFIYIVFLNWVDQLQLIIIPTCREVGYKRTMVNN